MKKESITVTDWMLKTMVWIFWLHTQLRMPVISGKLLPQKVPIGLLVRTQVVQHNNKLPIMDNCTYVNRMVIYRLEDDGVIVNLMFKVSWRTRLRSRLGIDRLRIVRSWSTHLPGFVYTISLFTGFNEVLFIIWKEENMTVFKTMSSNQ